MAFSYSFHLSTKGNSLSTVSKVSGTSRHNLRQYESKDYDKNQIEILQGSDSIMNDVRGIYQKEFDAALQEYNSKVRPDRQIDDYLKAVSDKKQTDVACEIIVQVGDMDFWQDKSLDERKQMTDVFKGQLEDMKELVPDFKIASAVIHYDEKSPHMHVVGVPVHEGYKKGLNKQVSKTKVFTKDSLSMLQDKMRERVEDRMKDMDIFKDMELKAKERGRNKDYRKEELAGLYDIQKQEQTKQEHVFELDAQLRDKNKNIRRLDKDLNEIKAELTRVTAERDKAQIDLQAAQKELERTADRQEMNMLLDGLDDAIKNARIIGERVAHEDLNIKKPMFGSNDKEVSLGSVQRASWALERELKELKPVVEDLKKTEQKLTDMSKQTEKLIEDKAQEITRQIQEQLFKDARQAEKDRKKAHEAKLRYEELKNEQESYILGTAEDKAQNLFNDFINKNFGQDPADRGARLEQFADSLTMKDGRSVLDAFNDREQERQSKLTREYERTIRETMRQAQDFEESFEDYDFER